MKGLKMIIMTVLITLLMTVCAFGETVRVVKLDLNYDGKTVQYREQEVHVIVDGKELQNLDMPAVIIDSRTLVPLRAIFEAMGAKVSWQADTQKITAEFADGKTVIMFVNNKAGVVNGNAFNMDVAPKIINDRTMVPVRAVAEAVGADVTWDDATRTVNISSYVIGGDGTGSNDSSDKDESSNSDDNQNSGNETSGNETTIEQDPQKVTDLSHVDSEEIDKTAGGTAVNEVNVTSVTVNGNDSYTIKTSGKIWQYRYATVLGTKVAVDIYGGSLAVASTNIPVKDAPVDQIRVAQYAVEPYKIVRVVFDLTETAGDYYVTKSSDGTSITVNFGKEPATEPEQPDIPVIGGEGGEGTIVDNGLTSIDNIKYAKEGDNETVTIYGDDNISYSIFTLSNPYRIVVDMENSSKNVGSMPDTGNSEYIKNIRMSQFSETSTRIVIEVADGVEYSSSVGNKYVKLSITKPEVKITQSLINDGKTIRFTKTSGLNVSNITKNYDPYSGNTVINLNGDFGSVYENKTLTYSSSNEEFAYISSAKFNTSNGKTTITVTPSLIAEYNIYENGDYIYIDMVDPKTVYDAVVLLDAGHGGTQPGAIVNGVYEKDINLDIAKRVYDLFEGSNVKVYVTRLTDKTVDNYKRAYMANYGADMFISIHCNSISGNVEIYGTETLYAPHSGEGNGGLTSYTLASTIQKYVSSVVGTHNRGVKERSDLIVLKRTTVPAALLETGFMTDENDMSILSSASGRQKYANAIYQAINEVVNKYNYR